MSSRLESTRRELTNFSQQTSTYAHQLAQIEEQLAQTLAPEERAALEDRARDIKVEMKTVAAREQDARTREVEAFQIWQQEEARWNDLIARLQQLAQR